MDLLLIEKNKLWVKRCNTKEATELTGLDRADLEWSVEKYGRCDTDEFVAIPYDPNNKI